MVTTLTRYIQSKKERMAPAISNFLWLGGCSIALGNNVFALGRLFISEKKKNVWWGREMREKL